MSILTIDFCMWAYYFDEDAPEHTFVTTSIDKASRSERIVISTVIIMEVAHFLIKNLSPHHWEGQASMSFLVFYLLFRTLTTMLR